MADFQPPAMPPPGPAPAPWSPGPANWLTPAPLGTRLGAYLLDALLIVVTAVIGWLIWSIVLWSKGYGASPGKQLLGLRVVDANTGITATGGTMALRELVGKWLLGSVTCGITSIVSAFVILFGERHTGVWDAIAGTVVTDRDSAPPASPISAPFPPAATVPPAPPRAAPAPGAMPPPPPSTPS